MLWTYLIQICQGLKYLHQKRILHRDIKPRNIFLDGDGNIKIGDMGLGRALDPGSQFAETGVGTPLYFSPEMCQEKPYNQKSDIWAFGCLMYELASREPPFMASNHMALAKLSPFMLPLCSLLNAHPSLPQFFFLGVFSICFVVVRFWVFIWSSTIVCVFFFTRDSSYGETESESDPISFCSH